MAYDDALRLCLQHGETGTDVTDFCTAFSLSGSWRNCCRTAKVSLLSGAPELALGDGLSAALGAAAVFSGNILDRSREATQDAFSIAAYDRGIYLKQNSATLTVRRQTAEDVTRQLCQQFGIPCGALAATGVALSRNFIGSSLYQIIQTLYTLASERTGERYQIRFDGLSLTVVIKERETAVLRLLPGSNLLTCTTAESVSGMVNSVAVYDDERRRVATYGNPTYQALYGLMEEAIRVKKDGDPAEEARALLEDKGVSTTISLTCFGNVRLITGNAVVIHEPVTGVDGLFWILSDTHTVAGGAYTCKLTVDFRNLMDEQTAGSVATK